MKGFIKALKILCIVVLSLLLLFNLCIMIQSKTNPDKVPSILGYKPFIVSSGSMESKMSIGDLVFVKNTDTSSLKVDDIIAFRDADDLVTTHRIVEEVTSDNQTCFKTKGDNNNTVDDFVVCESQIEGKYVGKISKLGSVILFIQSTTGFIVMMLIITIICIFIYMSSNKNTNKISDEELKEFEEFKKAKKKKHDVN